MPSTSHAQPRTPRTLKRGLAVALGALVACLPALGGLTVGAEPAHAAGSVSVSVEGSPELTFVADPVYQTKLRLNGSGFQSIQNGFGGVYVLFGWVDGPSWSPSNGGVTGQNYMYVPDDEVNPVGYANFVTFPGSSTAYAANGGELAADGTWSAVATVPGAKFTAVDRSGNPSTVDCTQVQCGIITIGAHGVVNANNETFTPITFKDLGGAGGQTIEAAPEISAPQGGTGTMTEAAPKKEQQEPTEIVEERVETIQSEAQDSSDDDKLVSILLWAVVGIGVLAVAAVAFLVWSVISSRKRTKKEALAAAAGETQAEAPEPEPQDAGLSS